MAVNNGFTFHAGIISSVLPRFRIYSSGDNPTDPNSQHGYVYASTKPYTYPTAWGPLSGPATFGDNSRYFMIFNYVKRWSLIQSPYLGFTPPPGYDLVFRRPIVLPFLDEIPEGTGLTLQFRSKVDPTVPASAQSVWMDAEDLEQLNSSDRTKNYIRFQALFKANVDAGTVPALDSIVIPYQLIRE